MGPGMFNDLKYIPYVLGFFLVLFVIGAFLLGRCTA